MRGDILALDAWLDPDHPIPSPVYLDANDWEAFVLWLDQDPTRAQRLRDKRWKVRLFQVLLNRYYGPNGWRNKRLGKLGIEFDDAKPHQADEMFIAETLRAYFHNDPGARPQAELMALARRQSGNAWITVVSQHRAFWRIPLVNTYFIDSYSLKGPDDLPAQFDFFMDLNIHNLARQAAENRVQNGDYPTAVMESIKEFFSYVRQIISSTDDGYNLMRDTFSCQRWHKHLAPEPKIQLNNMSTVTEVNEQKGFRDIACGVASALRNPIAHQPVDGAFIQSRYGSKRSTLKVLCLLSILLERIDQRVP